MCITRGGLYVCHELSSPRVSIPKPKGGTRLLGIPTVTDRLIQQAIMQVLQPKFDREFSESSFGFRLRCIKWRQWRHAKTRLKKLLGRGLPEQQAAKSAYNGRGPWWNSGAGHMNLAFPSTYFERLNLISLARLVGKTDWLK